MIHYGRHSGTLTAHVSGSGGSEPSPTWSGSSRRADQCPATADAWLEWIESFLHRQQHVSSGDVHGYRARVCASTVLSMVMTRMFSRDDRACVMVTRPAPVNVRHPCRTVAPP